MRICVYGASSNEIDEAYLQAGERLGEAMAKRGHGLVFGGGQKGMMGAAARGMTRFGGEIIGVAPRFFDVEGVLYQECTEFIFTDTTHPDLEFRYCSRCNGYYCYCIDHINDHPHIQ